MAEFEHALFMLLLLVGILIARPPLWQFTPILIVAGLLLVLLPPLVRMTVPWDLILFLVIPLLFWQNARNLLQARWRMSLLEILLWILAVLLIGFSLLLTGYLRPFGTILFGIVSASLLWLTFEPQDKRNQVSQIGPLTLIFLLTEVAVAVETPNRYIGGLFSGAAIGIGVALLALAFARKYLPDRVGWVALGQVYIAYLVAVLIDVSGVAASLLSVIIFAEVGLREKNGVHQIKLVEPLNNWIIFGLVLLLFVFLGWQAHQPLSLVLVVESLLGLGVGLLIAWLGMILKVGNFYTGSQFWQAGLRLGVFILTALLLWPRNILIQPLQLSVAIGLAILMILLTGTLRSATAELRGE